MCELDSTDSGWNLAAGSSELGSLLSGVVKPRYFFTSLSTDQILRKD
jgi:hypothetical protein